MKRLLLVAVSGCFLAAGSARAETGVPYDWGPPCASAEPVLPTTLPANIPGIPVRGVATSMSLLAPDGTAIPVALGAPAKDGYAIASWATVLAPGVAYKLRWSDECNAARELGFVTTDAKPLPTTAGTLTATVRSVVMPCDDAGRPVGTVSAEVRLTPSGELTPFLGVAATELLVTPAASFASGQNYGAAATGSAGVLSQKCPFGPREFAVSARVRIPNGPTLTTDPLTVSLPCPTTCVDEPSYTADANAGTGSDDAGSSAAPAAPDAENGAQCSSSSPARSAPAAIVLAALAAASMASCVRRSRSR